MALAQTIMALGALAAVAGNAQVEIAKPLIAHWDFDEPFGSNCHDSSPNAYDASLERGAGLHRIPGLFGNALSLSGAHMLRVPEGPDFSEINEISLSAWTIPVDLGSFREIFRKEDGDQRVLFSYQGDGTILSLGLNIGGYVECDAEVNPANVLDGNWHHCAATFDGELMRVYLDGRQIGELARPGKITAGGIAPGCIGSSNGGENFQGALDDLCIYAEALTPEEVAAIHASGASAISQMAERAPADEPKSDHPLIVHWTFNETGVSPVIGDSSGHAGRDIAARAVRTRGVHGNAVSLSGEHALGIAVPTDPEMAAITFSAWARPTTLAGYCDVFRKDDGNQRLLFSFQENGTILSLGLDIGGYIELDAATDAAELMDGSWHHLAGTFDGKAMRVYVDGREIDSLERPGAITTGNVAWAFIGSSNGTIEHYQGGLDDLRVYSAALTAEEIGEIHAAGQAALQRFAAALDEQISAFYTRGDSFAQSLEGARQRLLEGDVALGIDPADVVLNRMRSDFPEDSQNFVDWTGVSPVEYIASRDDRFQTEQAERLVGLMLEYQPLTDAQKARQTAEDRAKWAAAEAFGARLAKLEARGEGARFSPEWVEIILEAGARIDFRPRVSEAVAPYIRPETPETRDLTLEEARETLERDWLHQAGGDPSPERIAQEIEWAKQLTRRLNSPGDVIAQLGELAKQTEALEAPDEALYFAVRELKREIMFANPVVDFRKILLVDMPFPQGSEWPHETRHRLGYMAVPGARLLVLDGLSPEGKLTQLMPQAPLHGSFWRPDVSFDGERIVFCFKPHNEKSFHLYEINADGTGLRQLTDGPYDDLDPIYLPDGHIIFSTTRGHTYVRCMPPTNAYVLARCDSDGENVYLVSANNEPDYLPSVMDDGRVIYTRWEYTDKPLWRAQALWTINPDGTHVSTFWGNQSVWPDLLKDARNIPGSNRVMFTGSAHHGWFSGAVGIIDPDKGFNFPNGITKVTADLAWPEVGDGPTNPIESTRYHGSGSYSAYYSPYPLSETEFIVSANRSGEFVLYLMDVDGNRELIYEGVNNILHAIPLKARPKPAVIPDSVEWPSPEQRAEQQEGVIYSSNIYEGAAEAMQDKAKFLRVLSIDPKTYTYWHKRPYASTGPVVSMVQSEGVKRVIGTVPIEEDGSVAFRAPAGQALHFQLLDGQYRALQTMRSFVGVMPGETRGCLGCHELHSKTPDYGGEPIALRKEPRKITPPPWGDDTVSYDRYVQPVLDRHCGDCHQGEGEARDTLDLTRRPGYGIFDEPYVTLIGNPTWGAPYVKPENPPPGFGIANTLMVEGYAQTDPVAYQTPPPMTQLSYKSELVEIASSGEHYGVKVDEVSRRKLIAWIDAMCPYRGDEEVRQIPDPVFQGIDWLAVRPRIETAPVIVRPGPVD